MSFLFTYRELIVYLSLFTVGFAVYMIATRNRGSFADTPDWSKVVRRIIELVCVFACLLLTAYAGWSYVWLPRMLLIVFPVAGLGSFFFIRMLIARLSNRRDRQFKENLSEHLLNAVILAVFIIATLLVVMLTVANGMGDWRTYIFTLVLFDFFLSALLAFLLYQLYYLILINKVPSDETVQIARICKELNH